MSLSSCRYPPPMPAGAPNLRVESTGWCSVGCRCRVLQQRHVGVAWLATFGSIDHTGLCGSGCRGLCRECHACECRRGCRSFGFKGPREHEEAITFLDNKEYTVISLSQTVPAPNKGPHILLNLFMKAFLNIGASDSIELPAHISPGCS